MHRPHDRADSGFTLVELLVTLSVGAVLTGLAGPSLAGWSASNAHKGTRDEVVSALRNVAQRALSEGRTYCVAFQADGSWRTYRRGCGSTAELAGSSGAGTAGSTVAAAFPAAAATPCTTGASSTSCAYFYPRGTASPGTVTVTRSGKPTFVVTVEQLTSRVYSD